MEKKKVLILFEPLGVGHEAAARAIAEELALKYPDIEVKNIDISDYSSEIFRQAMPFAYNYVTSKIPFIYECIYKYYNHKLRQKSLSDISNAIFEKSRFVKFVKEFSPDFIISTNPLPMQLVSKTKEKNIIDILSANVCTDFGFHSFWYNEDVNYYFVADEDIKKSLVEHGVDSNKIKVTGIPTSLKFSKILDRKKIVDGLGFNASRPILLIVGGRTSYNNLFKVVGGIKEKNKGLQVIVVAGRDKILYKKMKVSKISKDPNVKIFGFVDNIEEYMTVADLILTKAGGLTVSECLVKKLPMVINDIIPGQEEDNVNYVVSNGAGVRADNAKKSVEVINKLFSQPEKLAEMKENCGKISKPDAAKDLVDFVVSKIQTKS